MGVNLVPKHYGAAIALVSQRVTLLWGNVVRSLRQRAQHKRIRVPRKRLEEGSTTTLVGTHRTPRIAHPTRERLHKDFGSGC